MEERERTYQPLPKSEQVTPQKNSRAAKKTGGPLAKMREHFSEVLNRRQRVMGEAFQSGANRLRSDKPERSNPNGSRYTGPPQEKLSTRYVRERAGNTEKIRISTIVPEGEELPADISRFEVKIMRTKEDGTNRPRTEWEKYVFSKNEKGKVHIDVITSDIAQATGMRELQDKEKQNKDNLLDLGIGLRFTTTNANKMKEFFDRDLPNATREAAQEYHYRKDTRVPNESAR